MTFSGLAHPAILLLPMLSLNMSPPMELPDAPMLQVRLVPSVFFTFGDAYGVIGNVLIYCGVVLSERTQVADRIFASRELVCGKGQKSLSRNAASHSRIPFDFGYQMTKSNILNSQLSTSTPHS